MRKIYCDCCKREIKGVEPVFSMEIKRWEDPEIIIRDMCLDCYEEIENIVDHAESWRKRRQ